MLPNIWIFDTYSILLIIGVIGALLLFNVYAKKNNLEHNYRYDVLILACVTVAFGIVSAIFFQLIFNLIKYKEVDNNFPMTFFGGLVGGVLFFIIAFKTIIKNKHKQAKLSDIFIIAPACITLAHGFGRIGCFCAGCCYGIESDSIFAISFPGHTHAVLPTQLFEAIFLFIISGILFYLAYKKNSSYTFPIYLLSYGIFRFFIEFIRGDDRGAFLFNVLSPSQAFSILAIASGIIYIVLYNKAKE